MKVGAGGFLNETADLDVVHRIRPPNANFHALETGVLDPDGHVNLIFEGNLLLVGWTRPDAGEIGVDAVFMAAEQLEHRLSGDLADGVPNRVFDAAPSPQTLAQLALDIEQVLADELLPS